MLDTKAVTVATDGPSITAADLGTKQFSFRELTWLRFTAHPSAKWAGLGLIVIAVACYGAPVWHALFPNYIQSTTQFDVLSANSPPSLVHLFGTDSYNGHDIFSLVLWGGRLSLLIGLGSMLIAVCIGVGVGASAGYLGGASDNVLMRFTDILLTLPVLLVVPLATRLFGQADPLHITVIFGLITWAPLSRIVRSQVLSLREQQFTEAARALGVPAWRIIVRHLMPNAIGPVVVYFTLGVASNIVLEAFISFLGLGLKPPTYSWGTILSDAQSVMTEGNWWWVTFPGLVLTMTVICINFVGDGLRDALDPKIV